MSAPTFAEIERSRARASVCAAALVGLAAVAVACANSGSSSPVETAGTSSAATATFVYATTETSVFAFRADSDSGALQGVPGSPFAITGSDWHLAFDRKGRFALAANADTALGYRIDAATGAVRTTATSSPLGRRLGIYDQIVLSRDGRFAYLIHPHGGPGDCQTPGDIALFAVDAATAALTPVPGAVVSTGVFPTDLAFTDRFAYVANSGDHIQLYGPCPVGSVVGYAVDGATGALATLRGSPSAVALENERIVAAGNAVHVLQARQYRDELRADAPPALVQFRSDAVTGDLAPLAVFRFPDVETPVSVDLDPLGRFVYVLTLNADVGVAGEWYLSVFRVEPSGGLTLLQRSVVPADAATPPVFEPSGRFAYRRRQSGSIEADAIDAATGTLTPVGPLSPAAAGVRAVYVVRVGS